MAVNGSNLPGQKRFLGRLAKRSVVQNRHLFLHVPYQIIAYGHAIKRCGYNYIMGTHAGAKFRRGR